MDRFVSRTPTWKTLNYSSMVAQSVHQNKCVTKTPVGDNNQKKPLQEKQLVRALPRPYDFQQCAVDVLPSNQANTENFCANSNDSGLSSASSISPQQIDENVAACKNASPFSKRTPAKKTLGKLSDYIDCPVGKENDVYLTITRTPKSKKKIEETGPQVQQTLEIKENFNPKVCKTPEKQFPKTSNMIMARIQRDLNSPSAAARVKAIRAMKSPTKSAYNQFDISETEKSFRLPEPPSLQEIMQNIAVYVEVRSGEDNRSAGVRKVIEALGARVCLSLNRETTHVVFKDGLLSTFKKATQMNIPIVSILWIEACKNKRRICDPKDFPISNLDRYENPELYTKMKRVKSMQPDSECNKRVRAKAGGTPKDSTTPTQKTVNPKKTSTFIGGTPTSSTTKKKTDISHFFKKIERPSSSATKESITDSPATQLLNRIHAESLASTNTPIQQNKNNRNNNNSDMESSKTHNYVIAARNALDFSQLDNAECNIKASIQNNIVVQIKSTATPTAGQRKSSAAPKAHSLVTDCEIETATFSMNTMAISLSTPTKTKTRRRSSINTHNDMSVSAGTPKKSNDIQTIQEECLELEEEGLAANNELQQKNAETPKKSSNRRKTLYTLQTMEQTDLMADESSKNKKTPSTKSSRRRTLYACKSMEISETNSIKNPLSTSATSNRRRTCFKLKAIEQTEMADITDDNKAKPASEEKSDETEANTNTPKVNKRSYRRRTLIQAPAASSPNITSGHSICLTPTNFQKGRVASSTLLEDTDCRSELVATPPADATTGKLLEETEKCATPLMFSSTRQPGNKRRTLFDVSMDIITQRLQCINQSARKSLAAPPPPSAEVVSVNEKQINTPITGQTPHSSTEALNECVQKSEGDSNTLKKKRKLFISNEMLNTPPLVPDRVVTPLKLSQETDKLITPLSNSSTKRRRTLMPISQPQPTTNVTLKESKSTATVRKRRSTLDFEQNQNAKGSSGSSLSSLETKASIPQPIKPKKTRVLVYTNMHQQQIDVIKEAIQKLGSFTLESCVTNATTHLVSLEPRRTLNLLRALAKGLWILDYSWIVDSLNCGKWLPEESHELKDFSRGIEICRSERQAFGCKYKCELFRKIGAFYVSSKCCPVSKENMQELIMLCGGQVVNTRQKARYIIGDANRTLEDKLYLTPFWVLDSITQMQIMKVHKYLYTLPNGKAASQPAAFEKSS